MRVLVTGGSGVIGEGLIPHLIEQGHHVRLLTRRSDDAAREWPDEVESFPADVTQPQQLAGAVDGCDAVVHITGIIAEDPPDVTFEKVNVGGTRHLLTEAARAGSPRVVFISSLGAERGSSAYHASKREAEAIVREYDGPWVILRPGAVYGPGDDVVSKLLNLHRTLPVTPLIGDGEHQFQPVWYLDAGKAIARALAPDVEQGVYEIAGDELTSARRLLDALEKLTGRSPMRVPIPEFLAGASASVAQAMGITSFPLQDAQFRMLIEENVVQAPEGNALTKVFGVTPTPLAEGLRLLVDAQPEQRPQEGVGGMERKRFWVDITASRYNPDELMDQFRKRCVDLMPIEFDAEPGSPKEVTEGVTMTASLPMRGNIQIRVEESEPRTVTFATLRGHPLAGVVRFTTSEPSPGVVRFRVSVFARAATMLDWLALSTVGGAAQNSTWRTVVERVLEVSGGTAEGVEEDAEVVSDEESKQIEKWIGDLITNHKRVEHERQVT